MSENKVKKKKKPIKLWIMDIVVILVLIAGIGAMLYPFVSDTLNEILDQQIISYYQKQATKENKVEADKRKQALVEKNKQLAEAGSNPGADPFSDERNKKEEKVKKTTSYFKQHTIGVIRIPKINVKLPIFDKTSDLLLEKGATVLEGTSYPTGGSSTHSVISAHRGLPEAKLFTDLPKLTIGDTFFIEIGEEILAYEVDQTKVIEPTQTSDLLIEDKKDLVTLLTCTPYMVNTHRLLVRGHRIPYVPEKMNKALEKSERLRLLKQIGILMGSLLLLLGLILGIRRWFFVQGINQRTYVLEFKLLDGHKNAVADQTFQLLSKNGKHVIYRKGEPIELVTNNLGEAKISGLKGGNYRLKGLIAHETVEVMALLKKVKQTRFTLIRKSKNIQIEKQSIDIVLENKKAS